MEYVVIAILLAPLGAFVLNTTCTVRMCVAPGTVARITLDLAAGAVRMHIAVCTVCRIALYYIS